MQIKAENIAQVLAEIYSGFCNYPLVGITDDGACLCEKCMKAETELISNSLPRDGWHICAIENEEEGYFCDHCGDRIGPEAEEDS